MKSKQCLETLTISKRSLFLFVQREGCFTGIERIFLLLPCLLGLPLLQTGLLQGVWLCLHGGRPQEELPCPHRASPVICSQNYEIDHPDPSFLTANTLCSLGHPPPWGVTVSHQFSRFCTQAPHPLLSAHCSSLHSVPCVLCRQHFLFHTTPVCSMPCIHLLANSVRCLFPPRCFCRIWLSAGVPAAVPQLLRTLLSLGKNGPEIVGFLMGCTDLLEYGGPCKGLLTLADCVFGTLPCRRQRPVTREARRAFEK